MSYHGRIAESLRYIRKHTSAQPTVGIILGSGLGDFADSLHALAVLSTHDIPHYPRSSVEGHRGRLVFATYDNTSLLAFQGRIHFYESNDLDPVVYPIHIAHGLGIKTLIVTNAAGGINRTFEPGDLMIITDQINLTFQRGIRTESGMTLNRAVYSPRLITLAETAAAQTQVRVRKGIYAGLTGPSYETAAEIEMLSRIGADAVGMSTVFEVSLASALQMEVLGISCITNLSTGISSTKLSHTEVTEVGNRVKGEFSRLLLAILAKLSITA